MPTFAIPKMNGGWHFDSSFTQKLYCLLNYNHFFSCLVWCCEWRFWGEILFKTEEDFRTVQTKWWISKCDYLVSLPHRQAFASKVLGTDNNVPSLIDVAVRVYYYMFKIHGKCLFSPHTIFSIIYFESIKSNLTFI